MYVWCSLFTACQCWYFIILTLKSVQLIKGVFFIFFIIIKTYRFSPSNIKNSKRNPKAVHWCKDPRPEYNTSGWTLSLVPVSTLLATAQSPLATTQNALCTASWQGDFNRQAPVKRSSEVSSVVNYRDDQRCIHWYKPVCERREMSCSGRTTLTEFKHVSVSVNEEASVWILYWETSVWAWQRRTRCPAANTHTLTQPSISHLLVSLWCIQIHRFVSSIKTNEPAHWHDESKTSRK